MDKIKKITDDLQRETNECKIIPKLIELYNIYSSKQIKNYKELNHYLLNSILPPLLCNCIKQNFSQFSENWTISYQLSCFLLNIITFNDQSTNAGISNDLLKNIIESHLILLKRLQKYYQLSSIESLIKMETSKEDCFNLIQSLILNIEKMIRHFGTAGATAAPYLLLKSPWFLQLFISDNQDFFILLIQLFTLCIQLSCDSFKQLKHSIRIDILDELIYHLSIIDISKDIESLLKCFVVLLKNIPELCGTVLKRYRGIQLLLTKWLNHFSNTNENQKTSNKNDTCKQLLEELIHLIDEYKAPIKGDETVCVQKQSKVVNLSREQAATTIQSVWRGYSERKKLKCMNTNIAKFQRQFRERQLKKVNDLQKTKLEKEFQHTINMNRHKRYRQQLESEAKLWSSLPPRLVEIAWNKKREEAAITIQRYCRGYITRKEIKSQQGRLKRDKAARIIQLYFRKYLSRRECLSTRKCIPPMNSSEIYQMKKKDSLVINKEEVLRDHRRWCETHQEKIRPISQLEDLHNEIQVKLDKYLRIRRISSIKNQSRQVTLTRMKIDSDLLLNETTDEMEQQTDVGKTIPENTITSPTKTTTRLNEIVNKHIQCSDIPNAFSQFSCRVQPLANFAQMEHHDMMTMMNSNKSWWNVFMLEWRRKQNEWLKSYSEKNDKTDSRTTTTTTDTQDLVDTELPWLPDKFIEEMEEREIFTKNK